MHYFRDKIGHSVSRLFGLFLIGYFTRWDRNYFEISRDQFEFRSSSFGYNKYFNLGLSWLNRDPSDWTLIMVGAKIMAWFKLKMIETVKWFKRSKWWKLLLTSGFINLNDSHNGYKRWFACFLAKKSKIDHLWSSENIKESLWSFLFALFTCSVNRSYLRFV